MPTLTEVHFVKKAEEALVGKKIVGVRYMTDKEMTANDFYKKGIVIELSDNQIIYPLQDEEGNGPGAMGTSFTFIQIIPRI